jgi:hypothetical protein
MAHLLGSGYLKFQQGLRKCKAEVAAKKPVHAGGIDALSSRHSPI